MNISENAALLIALSFLSWSFTLAFHHHLFLLISF